jgi:hypothetical protein
MVVFDWGGWQQVQDILQDPAFTSIQLMFRINAG